MQFINKKIERDEKRKQKNFVIINIYKYSLIFFFI